MLNEDNEILNDSPKIKIYAKEKIFPLNYIINNKDKICISLKKSLNNTINRNNNIIKSISNKKLSSSNNKTIEGSSMKQLYLEYLNTLNKIQNNNANSINDLLNSYSKIRINTQIEKIANKLYDNSYENEYNTTIKNRPNYFRYVLNEKNINNLKKYIKHNNYPNYEMGNKYVKRKKISKNNLFNLSIKELQKLYYDIDYNKPNKIKLDENKNNISRDKYDYEKYASNKNIFNHPKLYVLDIKKNNILPKIQNKANEINIKLNYIQKKNERSKIQEEYMNFMYNTLNK